MSTKNIPTPTPTLICDLCDQPIDEYAAHERASLRWGYGPAVPNPKPKHFKFSFVRRAERSYNNKTHNWDFHSECLISTLEPIILAKREEADPDGESGS